jgi:NAD(P)-dependent dehydrogenase (short-subunit alcohol dehydrogenase family)
MAPRNSLYDLTKKPVWFITGCSTGFGRTLCELLIARDYRVVVTARKPAEVADLAVRGETLVLKLDVTDPAAIDAAVAAAEARFGRIDVLVNNAGLGYFAAIEEGDEQQIRHLFEVNVFGLSRMIRAVLPGMRLHGTGTIVNISSVGGLRSFPSLGYYSATKFAVEGLSEALWQEVEPLGLKVLVVEPSGFRTDWAGRSAEESAHQIGAYADTAGKARSQVKASSGRQPGDPERAAEAIVKAVESPHSPHHLLLGKDAFVGATEQLERLRRDFSAWESVTLGADYPRTNEDRRSLQPMGTA